MDRDKRDPKGYYALLGVLPSASTSEIKDAFRRKAMELHPDRNPSQEATRQFQLLNEAYAVLSEPSSRAQYDTIALSAEQATHDAKQTVDPVVCSCCGIVSAQPRYYIFYEVKSFIVQTTKSAVQGIFCSSCAEKKAIMASASTWFLGWWCFPWGPIYTVQAIYTNLIGGLRPPEINARLVAHQALFFGLQGKIGLARAVALDALALAKTITNPSERAKACAQAESLLELCENAGSNHLKNAWGIFRRPFFAQIGIGALIIGSIATWVNLQPTPTPPRGPKPYVSAQTAPPPAQKYVRPATAPNGSPWPLTSSYVKGYPIAMTEGRSEITIESPRL